MTAIDTNRVWFITGASSGFGLALAEAVLARGDRAVITARRADALRQLEHEHADTALAVTADVNDPTARQAAVAAALKRFGHIDVLANIAGQGSLGAAEEFSIEQVRAQMELNFFAAAEMTREVLPSMRAQGSGHILNLTSIGGLAAIRGFTAYCASKFALEGWSEALRDEVASLGLHVTIVEPGGFRTEFSGPKNMRPAGRIDAYRPVIEPIEELLYGHRRTADRRPAQGGRGDDRRRRKYGAATAAAARRRRHRHLGGQARRHGRRARHLARDRGEHGARRCRRRAEASRPATTRPPLRR